MRTWGFDWRYAAAGLGWGLALGALSGLALALSLAVSGSADRGGAADLETVLALATLIFFGAFFGMFPGGAVGLVAGVATALTVGRTTGRRARWTAALTTLAAGSAGSTGILMLVDWPPPNLVVWLLAYLPVLPGAWLMARATESVQRAAVRREKTLVPGWSR